jgi:hypothetical protein
MFNLQDKWIFRMCREAGFYIPVTVTVKIIFFSDVVACSSVEYLPFLSLIP